MEIIEVNADLKTTKDCVDFINTQTNQKHDWKRVSKMELANDVVRVFKNENDEFCTVVANSKKYTKTARLFPELDFSQLKSLVDSLRKYSKFYYTHDYGSVYLNPYDLDLYVVGGDGGYFYSDKPKSQIEKEFEGEDFDYASYESKFVEFDEHEELSELNSVEWEAESDPDSPVFIEICEINLLD